MAESVNPVVKRCPVVKMWQVNLYCNICGKPMQRDPQGAVLMTNPPQIPYVCPMGHKLSSNMQFPFQQVEFDETQAEPLEIQMAPAGSGLLVPPGTRPPAPKPTASKSPAILDGAGHTADDLKGVHQTDSGVCEEPHKCSGGCEHCTCDDKDTSSK